MIGGLAAHPAEDEGDGSQAKQDRGRSPQLVLHNSIVDRVTPEQGCAQEDLRSSSQLQGSRDKDTDEDYGRCSYHCLLIFISRPRTLGVLGRGLSCTVCIRDAPCTT